MSFNGPDNNNQPVTGASGKSREELQADLRSRLAEIETRGTPQAAVEPQQAVAAPVVDEPKAEVAQTEVVAEAAPASVAAEPVADVVPDLIPPEPTIAAPKAAPSIKPPAAVAPKSPVSEKSAPQGTPTATQPRNAQPKETQMTETKSEKHPVRNAILGLATLAGATFGGVKYGQSHPQENVKPQSEVANAVTSTADNTPANTANVATVPAATNPTAAKLSVQSVKATFTANTNTTVDAKADAPVVDAAASVTKAKTPRVKTHAARRTAAAQPAYDQAQAAKAAAAKAKREVKKDAVAKTGAPTNTPVAVAAPAAPTMAQRDAAAVKGFMADAAAAAARGQKQTPAQAPVVAGKKVSPADSVRNAQAASIQNLDRLITVAKDSLTRKFKLNPDNDDVSKQVNAQFAELEVLRRGAPKGEGKEINANHQKNQMNTFFIDSRDYEAAKARGTKLKETSMQARLVAYEKEVNNALATKLTPEAMIALTEEMKTISSINERTDRKLDVLEPHMQSSKKEKKAFNALKGGQQEALNNGRSDAEAALKRFQADNKGLEEQGKKLAVQGQSLSELTNAYAAKARELLNNIFTSPTQKAVVSDAINRVTQSFKGTAAPKPVEAPKVEVKAKKGKTAGADVKADAPAATATTATAGGVGLNATRETPAAMQKFTLSKPLMTLPLGTTAAAAAATTAPGQKTVVKTADGDKVKVKLDDKAAAPKVVEAAKPVEAPKVKKLSRHEMKKLAEHRQDSINDRRIQDNLRLLQNAEQVTAPVDAPVVAPVDQPSTKAKASNAAPTVKLVVPAKTYEAPKVLHTIPMPSTTPVAPQADTKAKVAAKPVVTAYVQNVGAMTTASSTAGMGQVLVYSTPSVA